MMRVLIADDHPLLVDGVRNLLEAYGFEVVGNVGDGEAAVEAALRLQPDLVLMDIRMPHCDGLTATRLIKAQQPDMKILILTTSADDGDLFEAVKSGACGYLLKVTRGPDFIAALCGLEQGIPPFSPGLAERILREFARQTNGKKDAGEKVEKEGEPAHLTDRQAEVLRLVSEGLTYKETGARLSISEATVRYHMGEIMQILHLANRSQVIAYAHKAGREKEKQYLK